MAAATIGDLLSKCTVTEGSELSWNALSSTNAYLIKYDTSLQAQRPSWDLREAGPRVCASRTHSPETVDVASTFHS